MEKLKAGEIDAVIVVGGKPYKAVSSFKDDRFHLVTVDYDKPLQDDYLPATLSAKDYPNLIGEGEKVDTIAVPAVLAAYNWAPNTDRYRKLALFVDAFFTKFPAFQNPPFHPKWKEVSLAAPLADWNRLPAAQQWLDAHKVEPVARSRFDDFLKQNPGGGQAAGRCRQGSAVQAVQGVGGRAERPRQIGGVIVRTSVTRSLMVTSASSRLDHRPGHPRARPRSRSRLGLSVPA